MDVGALSFGTPLARAGQTGRNATADAARPATGANEQTAAPVAAQPAGLYISPVLRYDQSARVAVLFFRDFDTGETRDQIPAERVVEQYRRSGGPPPPAGEPRAAENQGSGVAGEGDSGGEVWAGGGSSAGDFSAGGGTAGEPSLGESYLAASGGQYAGPSPTSGVGGAVATTNGTPGAPTAGTPTAGTLVSFSV